MIVVIVIATVIVMTVTLMKILIFSDSTVLVAILVVLFAGPQRHGQDAQQIQTKTTIINTHITSNNE